MIILLPASALAEPDEVAPPLQGLVGEDLKYSIDFLFFEHLGEGILRLEATGQPDIYRAELIGRTLGIASWLSGERTQIYRSTMRLMPDGSFSSIEHVARVKKKKRGKWRRYRKICQFDCVAGTILQEKIKDGVVTSSEEHEIPEGETPVDMLTAFYNLRLGVYGEMKRGNKIFIPTYSSKGFTKIEVTVLTVKEQNKKKYFSQKGLLVKAVVDPEVFDTDTGNLYVWFNDEGVPARGIIEDMIGLGDIKGYLVEDSL
jgi:hypothetical protein